jgi:hypothetical protein
MQQSYLKMSKRVRFRTEPHPLQALAVESVLNTQNTFNNFNELEFGVRTEVRKFKC